jgi:predicted Zn-dependent protease
MLDFFKKMLDEQRTTPTFSPPYLLSHPLTETRLSNLEAVLRTPQWDRTRRTTASVELERVQVLVRTRMEPPQDVLTAYQRQAEAHPSSGRARDLLGLAQLETGQFDAARQSFEAARQLGVASVDRDLGRAWLRLRQPGQARECLQRALQTTPDDPVAHYDLALVLQADGDLAGAVRAFTRATDLAPDDAEAQYGLGMLLGRTGDTGRGLYHLGTAHALRGEYTEAVSCFDRALPQLPADSPERAAAQASFSELDAYVRTGHVPHP